MDLLKMNTGILILKPRARRGQRGISLLFALMALVILAFAAVALTRSVDTGTLIMGNLSFKQDAVMASSSGAEQAIGWLQNNANNALLDSDHNDLGYYASSLDALDPTGGTTSANRPLALVNWDGNNCAGLASATYTNCATLPFTGTAVSGNQVQWVITRLCKTSGAASGANLCVRPAATSNSTAVERGELNPGGRISGAVPGPYYRVIVRVQGARNTVSYTESLVHF
jgi:Tfp pilus assembly protein PilX